MQKSSAPHQHSKTASTSHIPKLIYKNNERQHLGKQKTKQPAEHKKNKTDASPEAREAFATTAKSAQQKAKQPAHSKKNSTAHQQKNQHSKKQSNQHIQKSHHRQCNEQNESTTHHSKNKVMSFITAPRFLGLGTRRPSAVSVTLTAFCAARPRWQPAFALVFTGL